MKPPNTCKNLRDSMRKANSTRVARMILKAATNRLNEICLVRWPALEDSMQRELDDCMAIARERGLIA